MSALVAPLTLFAALWGIGLYLALPRGAATHSIFGSRIGQALIALALVPLALNVMASAEGWEKSWLAGWGTWLPFHLLWVCALSAGAGTVLARAPLIAAVAFFAATLAQAELYVLLGSTGIAIQTVATLGGATMAACLFLVAGHDDSLEDGEPEGGREPLLVCVTAALLAAVLVGVVRHACTSEAAQARFAADGEWAMSAAPTALPRWTLREDSPPDFHLLNNTLVLAALQVSLGVAGLLARQSAVVVALAAGVVLHGATLSLVAFGALHANAAAEPLTWFALCAVLIPSASLVIVARGRVRTCAGSEPLTPEIATAPAGSVGGEDHG